MLVLLSAVIGGTIGFISSYFMWKTQIKYNNRNIAKGLHMEISSLERTLKLYADLFSGVTPPPPQSETDDPVEIRDPFYTQDSLFFVFRKEMSSFNLDLSKSLFEFYTYLLTAEKDRKIDKSDWFFNPANDEMKNCIIKAYELLPSLKELLKREFSKKDWHLYSNIIEITFVAHCVCPHDSHFVKL